MQTKVLATIDLGSNSFHMVIVEASSRSQFDVKSRYKRKVQLRSGLQEDGRLDSEAMARALDCFAHFSQRLQQYNVSAVDVVGTYTLRASAQIEDFLKQAESTLGYPIRIISGEEEARLIYVGVRSEYPDDTQKLVVDIGGGSTELIIGKASDALALTSLEMGCVSLSDRFFSTGALTPEAFDASIAHAANLLQTIKADYLNLGWEVCIGTSGTVLAISSILRSLYGEPQITLALLEQLLDKAIACGHLDNLSLPGLREDRENIFPGGLSILMAVFKVFGIEQMDISKSAVREGVMSELLCKIYDI